MLNSKNYKQPTVPHFRARPQPEFSLEAYLCFCRARPGRVCSMRACLCGFFAGRRQGLWRTGVFCRAEPGPVIFTRGVFVLLQGAAWACLFIGGMFELLLRACLCFLQGTARACDFSLGACLCFCKAQPEPVIFTRGVFVFLQAAARACDFQRGHVRISCRPVISPKGVYSCFCRVPPEPVIFSGGVSVFLQRRIQGL